MAGNDARLATGAAIEIDFKGVLLTRPGGRGGKQRAIARRCEARCDAIRLFVAMPAAEFFDGGKRLLFGEEVSD
jgi:hypothetical protein